MIVPPGSTIGIIGGGQLGRMLALSAARLGYRCHIYAPEAEPIAAEVAAFFTRGGYDDEAALEQFAGQVDVATYEFENIPAAPLAAIDRSVRLYPPRQALEIAQDRLREKRFIEELGGRVATFRPVDDAAGLAQALAQVGCPAILKTRRFGYDGKGQSVIAAPGEAEQAWAAIGEAPAILESKLAFDAEFSILLCRSPRGEVALWDAPHNIHRRGILERSRVPAADNLAPAIAKAEALARRAAEALDYVGVLAMEFFAVGSEAVFNEMAPRVHNSGHWTIEGSLTSQFENHIRALCGLPLGATDRVTPRVEMMNLVGDEAQDWAQILSDRTAHLHLYGKDEIRVGRKMGHVTRLIGRAEG